MKFTKLSLVAALAVSAAFAGGDIAPVEPVVETPSNKCAECGDITGAIKLYYGSYDRGAGNDLFSQNGALGDAYAELNYSRKLMDNVTANVGMAYITTLGLESTLVSGTWANHGPSVVDDVAWITTANVAIQLANTTLVLGRQQLATPFFFSETWGIAANTFDAAVAVNTDLPDTTLVAAWVGRGNGTSGGAIVNLNDQNFDGNHNSFTARNEAAYAFGAINKSISDVALQAWYYKIPGVADALWLQGDANFDAISVGAQYAATYANARLAIQDTDAYAFKLGYTADALSAYVAYSYASNDAGIEISNIATGHTAGSQSSLYTEAYWNYGFVGGQDAETIALGASYDLGMAKVAAQYTTVSTGTVNTATSGDMTEFALTASTKVGPINADLAYVYDEKGVAQNAANTVLVMLSLPFSL